MYMCVCVGVYCMFLFYFRDRERFSQSVRSTVAGLPLSFLFCFVFPAKVQTCFTLSNGIKNLVFPFTFCHSKQRWRQRQLWMLAGLFPLCPCHRILIAFTRVSFLYYASVSIRSRVFWLLEELLHQLHWRSWHTVCFESNIAMCVFF